MTTNEIWRNVPSLPGVLASNLGRIMREPHLKPMPKGGFRRYGGTPHFGVWEPKTRRYIAVIHGKTYKVHRLIAEAFHGGPPFPRSVVMHIDENSRNNQAINLVWGTQKENLNAPGFILYCKSRTGDNSPHAKHIRSTRK